MTETCKTPTPASKVLEDLEEITLKLHELTLILVDGLQHLHSSLQLINDGLKKVKE